MTFAQNVFQLSGPAFVRPGSPITMNVTLSGSSTPAATQFTITATMDITALTVTAGPVATAATKQIACGAYTTSTNTMTCIIYGLNENTIADGVLATVTATLSATPSLTSETFSLSGPAEATGPGSAITVTVSPINIATGILSNCDLLGTGTITAADATTIIGWVLGTSSPGSGLTCDVNGDGKCNVDDVEIIIAAVTGQPCTAINP